MWSKLENIKNLKNNKGDMNNMKNETKTMAKENKKGLIKSLLTPAVIITAMSTAITLYSSYTKSKKAVQGLKTVVEKARE